MTKLAIFSKIEKLYSGAFAGYFKEKGNMVKMYTNKKKVHIMYNYR